MKRFPSDLAWILCLLLLSSSPALGQTEAEPGSVIVLTGATVIDGTGAPPLEDTIVVVEGDRIACVGECDVPPGAEVIDARGKHIIPGLVDAHVHYAQTGWIDSSPGFYGIDVSDRFPYREVIADLREHPERFHRGYLCSGVTAVFDPGGPPWTLNVRDDARGSTAAPHYMAAGPLLTTIPHLTEDPAARGLNVHMADEEAARFGVRMLSWLGSDAVKVWGLEIPEDREAVRALLRVVAEEAERAGLPVIAHAHTLESAKDALREGGASVLLHPVSDAPVDDEFLELARRNNAVYVTTMGYLKTILASISTAGPDRTQFRFPEEKMPLDCVDPTTRSKLLLTDSLPPVETDSEAWRTDWEAFYPTQLENAKRIHEAGITVAMGTDAGNPFLAHGPAIYPEMQALIEAGLTPMEVLVASTRNGAKAMGRLEEFGTLEPGKIADLVVLTENPLDAIENIRSIDLVVRGGQVWTREELEYR